MSSNSNTDSIDITNVSSDENISTNPDSFSVNPSPPPSPSRTVGTSTSGSGSPNSSSFGSGTSGKQGKRNSSRQNSNNWSETGGGSSANISDQGPLWASSSSSSSSSKKFLPSKKNFYSCTIHQQQRSDVINAVAYSTDGRWLAVGGDNDKLMILDTTTYKVVYEQKLNSYINTIVATINQFAVGGRDKVVVIIDTDTFKARSVHERQNWVNAMAYSSDGMWLAVGGADNKVAILSTTNFKVIHESEFNGWVNAIASSPDGRHLALAGEDEEVIVLNTINFNVVQRYKSDGIIYSLAYSPDSSFLVVGGYNKKVITLNSSFEVVQELVRDGSIYSLCFSPSGNFIAVGSEKNKVIILDSSSFDILQEYERDDAILSVSWSPNGKHLAAAGGDKNLYVLDTSIVDSIDEEERDSWVWSTAYTTDGKYLAVGGRDGSIIIKNGLTFENLQVYKREDSVYSLCWSPDSSLLALGQGNCCYLVDGSTFKTIQVHEKKGWVLSVSISPDAKYIAAGGRDSKVTIYETSKPYRLVHEFKRGNGAVNALAFSPNGSYLSLGGDDKKVHVFDTSSFDLVNEYRRLTGPVHSLAYTPDGRFLMIGSNNTVALLEIRNNWRPFMSPIIFPSNVSEISFVMGVNLNERSDFYSVAIANGNFITTMKIHKHIKTPPKILLRNQDDDYIFDLIKERNNKLSPLGRNSIGKTLISCAVEENRLDVVSKLVQDDPTNALIPNDLIGKSNGIFKYLAQYHQLNALHVIADAENFQASTSEVQLDEMVDVLLDLGRNQVTRTVIHLLEAGQKGSIKGFVNDGEIYATEFRRNIFQKFVTKLSLPLSTELKPRSSRTSDVSTAWENLEKDDKKRVRLIIKRVLLPNLASFEALQVFIRMNDMDVFNTLSLSTSIDATWYKWARKMFLSDAIIYMCWLIIYTTFCYLSANSTVKDLTLQGGTVEIQVLVIYLLAMIVLSGVCISALIELRQVKTMSLRYYFMDGWNLWQWISKLLVILTVITRFSSDNKSTNAYRFAISLLFNWFASFFYLRGFEEVSWIVIALVAIFQRMIFFIFTIFMILFNFSIGFYALARGNEEDPNTKDDPTAFDSFIGTLRAVFFASVTGNVDPEDLNAFDAQLFALFLLILMLIVIFLISLNALIAFISDAFEKVLSQKSAVLKKQRAAMIIELYGEYL